MSRPIDPTVMIGASDVSDSSGLDPLLELLVQWEERRAAGDSVSAEELCPTDLSLQQQLRERIARREQMLAALDLQLESPPGSPAARQFPDSRS